MATKNKTKSQRIKDIEYEITWYGIRKPIAEAMRQCGQLGFEVAGHGCGFGGEDFSLMNSRKDLYVNFCDRGNSCEVTVSTCDTTNEDGYPIELCKGTIGKAMKFIGKK
jgi:hypothetical protein